MGRSLNREDQLGGDVLEQFLRRIVEAASLRHRLQAQLRSRGGVWLADYQIMLRLVLSCIVVKRTRGYQIIGISGNCDI
jgi:hypothetical protein